MAHESSYEPKTGIEKWIDKRLPLPRFTIDFITFPTPRNLNYWWAIGAVLMVCLVVQIVTGIVLAMHYTPHADHAFDSVEHIMRNVPLGWLIRYMHANGASMFFFAVYLHMLRGLYYGSYKAPREILWMLGVIIFLVMILTAFLGYVLPWGQMSYWAATVITDFVTAIPFIGESMNIWLKGDYAISNATLNRFFSLHYLLPFVILGLVILHVWALHEVRNNNPEGVEVKDVEKDTLPFHPYYTMKDVFVIGLFLILFAIFIFYMPNALGHADNYIPADPQNTPAHIVPEWYFLPFYAILRAVPDKLLGLSLMVGSIAVLFVLPWLDTSKIRSMRYRPQGKIYFLFFVVAVFGLGYIGGQTPDDPFPLLGEFGVNMTHVGRVLTLYYFAYFLLILPLLGLTERGKSPPVSIAHAVEQKAKKKKAESV